MKLVILIIIKITMGIRMGFGAVVVDAEAATAVNEILFQIWETVRSQGGESVIIVDH